MDCGERFQHGIAERSELADPILRLGLGVVILLSGAHKLVGPDPWTIYVAPPFGSLVGVVLDLAVLFGLTGEGADVLIRDLGLLALAVGVTANAAATVPRGPDDEPAADRGR